MNNQPQVNPKKLFIGNLPFSTTEGQLREIFSPHGTIEDLKLIIDRRTGQSKGIAFVEFSSEDEAQAAIKGVHDTEIDGRKIVVNVARPPKPREDYGFNNRNGRSNRF